MKKIQSNGENDKSLSKGLDELSQAYSKLPHEEPPELLDQAILNSAHRAVEQKPRRMKFGWVQGLTTAAVFVLALSLIFNQREQVPVFENGSRAGDPASIQREKAVKKQSPVIRGDSAGMELKDINESRQEVLRSAPLPAAPQKSDAGGVAVSAQTAEPAPRDHRATYAQDSLQAKRDRVDNDTSGNELKLEEAMMDEADLMADTAESEAVSKQSRAAEVTDPAINQVAVPAENDAEIDAEIEQRLQAIISLKQSGDKAWIAELELFKQRYPDYPLPEELSN